MAVNVNVIGRLGKDAELFNGTKGQFVAFDVATDDYANGNKTTSWFRVNSNQTAIAPYLKKGTMVNVMGTESVKLYTSKTGQVGIDRNIFAYRVDFVSGGSGSIENNTSETQPIAAEAVGKLNPPTTSVGSINQTQVEAVSETDLPF